LFFSDENARIKNMISDSEVDVGDMGCGDLIIALMRAMKSLETGQILKVRALDPGALADIPAWCKMRGYELLAVPGKGNDDRYYIKKR